MGQIDTAQHMKLAYKMAWEMTDLSDPQMGELGAGCGATSREQVLAGWSTEPHPDAILSPEDIDRLVDCIEHIMRSESRSLESILYELNW